MYDLSSIDLGKDEAEQDERLREYFVKTTSYENALSEAKTIIIGRKGSGKSAIFALMKEELNERGEIVIPITPDQYSWSVLKDYEEAGILPEQAHTNAWKMTLLSAAIWSLSENGLVADNSKIISYYRFMQDSYVPTPDQWFLNLVEKIKKILSGIKTQWVSFDFGLTSDVATPLRIINELQNLLSEEWPHNKRLRILIDRLDDSWDASEQAQNLIIGLLKAANQINAHFRDKIAVTVFLRSDIYDSLFFADQDKLRQNEETLRWDNDDLKAVVCERVRVSLNLGQRENNEEIWRNLFSKGLYRSRAAAEKYIIDRTFKRPRDIISFVRLALEVAAREGHSAIEPMDTRMAEEASYSQSKYKDLIIENQKQFPYVKDLLDSLSSSLHKQSQKELLARLSKFIEDYSLHMQPVQILRQLFIWGVIGVKRLGGATVKRRGGTHFVYYYEDPSINPLSYSDYYIHPSLRRYLNISEKRERAKS